MPILPPFTAPTAYRDPVLALAQVNADRKVSTELMLSRLQAKG